ncbi:MAG TPA: hypothetical protein VGO07_01595 [Candidatus Saccharimonadales bacterium]|nr:hypothetical protein [Candidatus Saccharimonadales bacterium]
MHMPAKKPKQLPGAPITDHGTYWTRPTAKPKSLPPIPSLGQLGQ